MTTHRLAIRPLAWGLAAALLMTGCADEGPSAPLGQGTADTGSHAADAQRSGRAPVIADRPEPRETGRVVAAPAGQLAAQEVAASAPLPTGAAKTGRAGEGRRDDPPAAAPADAAAGQGGSAEPAAALEAAASTRGRSVPAKLVGHRTEAAKPVDPVELNGPIFEGWPKPRAAIVISGELLGYLEPCGCAGLENQKGGLKRRHTFLRELAARGWPLAAIDLGGQIRRYGPQAEIKFRMAIESLAQIGYQAVGFGPQDLRLAVPQILYVVSNLPGGTSPFVAANVDLFEFESGFVERYRVLNVGGRRIGVTAILGEKYRQQINNDELAMKGAREALAEVVPALRDGSDFRILLSHAPPDESKALARAFPDFDLVVTAGGASEPPAGTVPIEGSRGQLLELGHKGMYVMVLGLFDDAATPVRVQRVPLDARFKDSPEMQAMLVKYQNELKTLGLEGLGVSPTPHPSGRKFAGSQACAECHTEATAVWEKTPHAHATETLVKLDPPRHYDPECLSCHVTGWDPQKYYPFTSGYLDLASTPLMKENGCENCHGPAADHVAAEQGDVQVDDARLEQLRAQLRLELEEGEAEGHPASGKVGKVTASCYECHDTDNSPDFDFKTYWPEVEHYGTD